MKLSTIKIATTALLGAVALAWGEDGIPPDERKRTFGNGVLSEHVSMYDLDNSGGLSVEEYQALMIDRNRQGRRHERFRDRWDKNHDGRIDARERALAVTRIRQLIQERRLRRFNEVDENSDGFLTEREFLAISAVTATDLSNPGVGHELFKHLDHNDDNRISKEEFLRSLNTVRPAAVEADPKARDSNTIPVPPTNP